MSVSSKNLLACKPSLMTAKRILRAHEKGQLDIDAPVGWLQWEALVGRNIAGPLRLGLHVLDPDEWLDAMSLSLDD